MHARRVGSVLWLRTELAHTKSLERDVSARVVRGGNVQQAVLRTEAVERSDYRVRQAVGPRHLVVVGICDHTYECISKDTAFTTALVIASGLGTSAPKEWRDIGDSISIAVVASIDVSTCARRGSNV